MISPRTILLGLVLPLIACKAAKDPRSDVAVRIETAIQAKPASSFTFTGTIRADKQVELAFRTGGFVDAISPKKKTRPVQAGDWVAKNTVLASLRLADFRAQLHEAGGVSREASSGYRKAKTDLERAKKLFAQGTISQAELDDARARHDALAGGAAAAGARATQASLALGDAQLKAPFDGIVLERRVEAGALVAPGFPAFVLADTSTVKVTFAVPDTTASTLATGREVHVTTEALPERVFEGHVTKIAAHADARTHVFDIEASFENPDGVLKVGMPAKIEVVPVETDATTSVLVPLSAVVRVPESDGFGVFILDDRDGLRVKRRAVDVARLAGNRVSVTRGIAPGERFVVQGATLLDDGARVVIVPGGA